jgi:hypothetical protein
LFVTADKRLRGYGLRTGSADSGWFHHRPAALLDGQGMIKRSLLVLGAALALTGIIYVGSVAILLHAFTGGDPFPPFMADYASGTSATFDQFIMQRFPVG